MSNRKSSYNAYRVPSHSPNIMVMTRDEFVAHTHEAFLAGIERGRFEEASNPQYSSGGISRIKRPGIEGDDLTADHLPAPISESKP